MKYVANLYSYEVKDLNDAADLYTIICDNEPYDTVEFETLDEAFAFVRSKKTDVTEQNGYYACEAWVSSVVPDNEDEADKAANLECVCGCEISSPEFTVEFDIYHGGIGAEAVFDNYRDALDELERCEKAAEAAGDEDIEFSIKFYNPYSNKPCVPYRPEPLPEEDPSPEELELNRRLKQIIDGFDGQDKEER